MRENEKESPRGSPARLVICPFCGQIQEFTHGELRRDGFRLCARCHYTIGSPLPPLRRFYPVVREWVRRYDREHKQALLLPDRQIGSRIGTGAHQ